MFNFWWSAGLLNGLEPISHPSPAKKIKFLFLDYIQLLMIGRAGRCTRTPSATPLQPKKKILVFRLCSTSGDRPGWSVDSNPICHPSPAKKIKCLFLDYVQLLWLATLVNRLEPCLPALSSQKNKMLVFGLCSTSDDWPRWSIDLNPVCLPSPANKIKCLFWIIFNYWWSARLVDGLKPRLPPLSS